MVRKLRGSVPECTPIRCLVHLAQDITRCVVRRIAGVDGRRTRLEAEIRRTYEERIGAEVPITPTVGLGIGGRLELVEGYLDVLRQTNNLRECRVRTEKHIRAFRIRRRVSREDR